MNKNTILLTGGAGFIGGHLAETLFESGYKVVVYDNLSEQIHGKNAVLPKYLQDKVTFIKADIRDRDSLKNAVQMCDGIIHLVAETGVGQSMYEVNRYFDVTVQGTALLWDILANEKHSVNKVVLTSSRAVYGEGQYMCKNCGVVYPKGRNETQLIERKWEVYCEKCGGEINEISTREDSQLNPTSIYAITKKTQEEICMTMGRALKINTAIVRYQNVYGSRQSLNNPYTGILSIFTSRLKNGNPILIYEDGKESRDFVHVLDVVQGTLLALEKNEANFEIFNISNGVKTTVNEIAAVLTNKINPSLTPQITGKYRVGDIRHCIGNIVKAEKMLGYKPKYDLVAGMEEFVNWAEKQAATDLSEEAEKELVIKGILK